MPFRQKRFCAHLFSGAAAVALLGGASAARAQEANFSIAPQPLSSALTAFSEQSAHAVIFKPDLATAKATRGVTGATDVQVALNEVLAGTGLTFQRDGDAFVIVKADAGPQDGSAGGGAETNVVQELVVTAQKKSENIQVVPIAISAFTQADLTTRQVAGGPDLMTQVPNFTFTKTNFSGYSIQIRGIGTQAISATVDPAVAVAFNNTPFIRNRFFEQEFYDLERIEVLRGPQGTLYGRNATAGVVNIISAKAKFDYEARASADLANYGSRRLEAMVNIPLVEDKAALRIAGAWTKRDGFVTNALTGDQTDGRDLWSTRVSLGFKPSERFSANLIWEHFQEDDDRLRSGKQLCKRDQVISEIGGVEIGSSAGNYLTQGCEAASMYSDDSFQVPEGHALPYYYALAQASFPAGLGGDPYVSASQPRDLRSIETTIKPEYRARTNTGELQLNFNITPSLTLASETAYSTDTLFSFQDFNRFNTAPGAFDPTIGDGPDMVLTGRLDANGTFCDAQLGCSNRLLGADLSTARSRQFSQELRLSSDFDGPLNFSVGANYLRYDTVDKYYVFFNSLSLFSTTSNYDDWQSHPYVPGAYDNAWCMPDLLTSNPSGNYANLPLGCKYMDPNPISSLNDNGRQYFLSKNPYKLISYAAFGEVQYQIAPDLKLTGGVRWTIDRKQAPIVPSWLLTIESYGTPVLKVVNQEWREPTGRVVLDWKPRLSFTDETMVYASFAHGYKAGGANPPLPANGGFDDEVSAQIEATHPSTFNPEFVNAFEIGTKNTLADGRLTLNANAFFYDYTGYQISQIVDRSALNLNFDAKTWGAELEADWRPMRNLRLGFKAGLLDTRLGKGSRAIDTMDRTAGNPDWMVVKAFPTVPSNCILPTWYILFVKDGQNLGNGPHGRGACQEAYYSQNDPLTGEQYTPNPTGWNIPDGYPGFDPRSAPNNGAGFFKDISGNQLPNAPHFTGTLTADYTLPLPSDWLMTLHGDFYYQSEAWTRVFNTEGYDKLKAYTNVNLAAIFTNERSGWKVMAYVKNVMDRDSITGAFLNSDDTGLTTNVFLTEPRLFGLRVTKEWTGTPMWAQGREHMPGAPYPFTLELGGGVEKIDAPNQVFAPPFASSFDAQTNPLGIQNDALDWSDSKQAKLTYELGSSGWNLAAGVRYGKANGKFEVEKRETVAGGCALGPAQQQTCDSYPEFFEIDVQNYGTSSVMDREKFVFADFTAGRSVGVGLLGRASESGLALGLRYAEFESSTDVTMRADGDWHVDPVARWSKPAQHTKANGSFSAERKFSGVGPVLSWDASKAIFGDDQRGRLNLDWTLTGGALLGRQKSQVNYQYNSYFYDSPYYFMFVFYHPDPTSTVNSPPIDLRRSKSVTAPVLGASLGLSYRVQRLKISGGYRIDKAFNVIDGGVDGRRNEDRTIQGPYFKVSVGFGG